MSKICMILFTALLFNTAVIVAAPHGGGGGGFRGDGGYRGDYGYRSDDVNYWHMQNDINAWKMNNYDATAPVGGYYNGGSYGYGYNPPPAYPYNYGAYPMESNAQIFPDDAENNAMYWNGVRQMEQK